MTTTELLDLVPEVFELADIRLHDVRRIGSNAMSTSDLVGILRAVAEAGKSGVEGVVILHGTATLEETAYFLDLTLEADFSTVLVGAQRPPGLAGSDALTNLHDAIRAATAPELRGAGVLVCLNGELHEAATVVKQHTSSLGAFASPLGPVGRVLPDGRVRLDRPPTQRTPSLQLPAVTVDLPRVDIAMSYLGADGTAIRAFVEAGARGIVSAGLLPGMPTPTETAAMIAAVQQGLVVVQSVRSGAGRVRAQAKALAAGIIPAGDLGPSKARILAAVGLAAGLDREQLVELFDTA
jgi:L-asparaginase